MKWMDLKGNVVWITMRQARTGQYIVAFDINKEPKGFAANRVEGLFPNMGAAICAAHEAARQKINS